jgi:ATP-dependent DNA ligase
MTARVPYDWRSTTRAVRLRTEGRRRPRLVVYQPDGLIETRNRRGERRDWLRGDTFERGLRRLADQLTILWHGTVLDGELIAGRFAGTMAALYGSKRYRDQLRFVVFDVPVLAGVDLRPLSWQERRERLELLAEGFEVPLELSPRVEPSRGLLDQMVDGSLGVVGPASMLRSASS